mgnify:CR=1 FL=1|tara:strand:+ start:441 stop:590 length:150 start_codon:yes stop_codon:yes gene_type:complete
MLETKQITYGTLLFVTIGIGFYCIAKKFAKRTQKGEKLEDDKKEQKKEE